MANIPTLHRIDVAKVGILSLGHLVLALYPPFLVTLLRLLIDRLGLSLTLNSLLASILMFSASLNRPLFGILSDRIGGGKAHVLGAHHGPCSRLFSPGKRIFSRTHKKTLDLTAKNR